MLSANKYQGKQQQQRKDRLLPSSLWSALRATSLKQLPHLLVGTIFEAKYDSSVIQFGQKVACSGVMKARALQRNGEVDLFLLENHL